MPQLAPTPPAADPATQQRCEQLFASHGARIHALARRLVGQDADDGVQEVFAATCRSLPTFRGESQLSTWFHRLAVRVLCAYRRRRDRRTGREVADPEIEHRLSSATLRRHADTPLDQLDASERRQLVLAAIENLSPPLREVLLLRGENLSYAEIATAAEIPLGTVKSRLAAATLQLAERLHQGEENQR